MEKRCSQCREAKSSALFNKDQTRHDGLSSSCKVCAKQAVAEWRRKNPERHRQSKRRWAERNPDKVAAISARKYQRNKSWYRAYRNTWDRANHAKIKSYHEKYRKANPHKAVIQVEKRRAMKLRAQPKWANEFFMEEAYRLAAQRTKVTGIRWHVDHIVPLISPVVCGLHCEANLQVIPASENVKKQNRYWPDMPMGVSHAVA